MDNGRRSAQVERLEVMDTSRRRPKDERLKILLESLMSRFALVDGCSIRVEGLNLSPSIMTVLKNTCNSASRSPNEYAIREAAELRRNNQHLKSAADIGTVVGALLASSLRLSLNLRLAVRNHQPSLGQRL